MPHPLRSSSNLKSFLIFSVVLILSYLPFQLASLAEVDNVDSSSRNLVNFAGTFATNLNQYTLNLPCQFESFPICCEALNSTKTLLNPNSKKHEIRKYRGVGNGIGEEFLDDTKLRKMSHVLMSHRKCKIHKEYVSSPYELQQIEKSKEWLQSVMPDREKRTAEVLKFVNSEEQLQHSLNWITLVREHMQAGEKVPPVTEEGAFYLSKFIMTKTCIHGSQHAHAHNGEEKNSHKYELSQTIHENVTWVEWIEPLSVHARNPFSFAAHTIPEKYAKHRAPLINSDFVLLQSGSALYNNSIPNFGNRDGEVTKHIMLDAGTSTFDSSMYWFSCGYSQRKISFDQIFGWELSLLDPVNFWKKVPTAWKPYYHFYNTPVTASVTSTDSPLGFIMETATEDDFVAFKLDIDHSATEIPIAQQILSTPGLADLIDEFFFELHFDCEILSSSWGRPSQMVWGDLVLDRHPVMEFFKSFRKAGIRSHFWP